MRIFGGIFVGWLLLACALCSGAEQAWKLTASEREATPNELVQHWQRTAANQQTDEHVELHFAVFDDQRATLAVIDQPQEPRRTLAEMMRGHRWLAGVNGGYFDPNGAPIGLLISQGRLIAPLQRARLITGVLTATSTRVDVVRATRFSLSRKISAAVQCGPLLVERSAPVAGLNDTRSARRTFAAVDGKGHAALGVSSAVSLAQLANVLCLTNVAGEMKIARALNLDGGSSSAFCFGGPEGAVSISEQKDVRDFVGIVPRAPR